LHVVGIAAMVLVLALILPLAWVPWLVAMVPLGRVATRAGDLRRSGTSPVPHLLVNGAVVALATALAFLFAPAGCGSARGGLRRRAPHPRRQRGNRAGQQP